MFDNLNPLSGKLYFLSANSPDELKKQLDLITLPTRIIAIYAQGSNHVAWILTDAKLIKQKKKGE